jgi:hypothetical protein
MPRQTTAGTNTPMGRAGAPHPSPADSPGHCPDQLAVFDDGGDGGADSGGHRAPGFTCALVRSPRSSARSASSAVTTIAFSSLIAAVRARTAAALVTAWRIVSSVHPSLQLGGPVPRQRRGNAVAATARRTVRSSMVAGAVPVDPVLRRSYSRGIGRGVGDSRSSRSRAARKAGHQLSLLRHR